MNCHKWHDATRHMPCDFYFVFSTFSFVCSLWNGLMMRRNERLYAASEAPNAISYSDIFHIYIFSGAYKIKYNQNQRKKIFAFRCCHGRRTVVKWCTHTQTQLSTDIYRGRFSTRKLLVRSSSSFMLCLS